MNNNDERDFDEERYNRNLCWEEELIVMDDDPGMVESDVFIVRDPTKVDAYDVTPYQEETVSIPAALVAALARAIRAGGENDIMDIIVRYTEETEQFNRAHP